MEQLRRRFRTARQPRRKQKMARRRRRTKRKMARRRIVRRRKERKTKSRRTRTQAEKRSKRVEVLPEGRRAGSGRGVGKDGKVTARVEVGVEAEAAAAGVAGAGAAAEAAAAEVAAAEVAAAAGGAAAGGVGVARRAGAGMHQKATRQNAAMVAQVLHEADKKERMTTKLGPRPMFGRGSDGLSCA